MHIYMLKWNNYLFYVIQLNLLEYIILKYYFANRFSKLNMMFNVFFLRFTNYYFMLMNFF